MPSLSLRLEEEGVREILGGSKKPGSEEEGETGKHARNVHRRARSRTGTNNDVGRQLRHAKAQNKSPHLHMSAGEEGAQEITGCKKIQKDREGGKTRKIPCSDSDGGEGDDRIHTRTGRRQLRAKAQNKLIRLQMSTGEEGTQEIRGGKRAQKSGREERPGK